MSAKQAAWRLFPYLIALFLAAAWYLVDRFMPEPPPVNQYVPATPPRQLALVPKVIIQPKQVKVYAQPAKAKLKLPPSMQQDPNLHVIAATKVKPGLHPYTVVATLNAETGETETLIRRDPLPWFRLEQTGELRIDYGYKSGIGIQDAGFKKIARLTLREDLLQVKALHFGGSLSLDSDGQKSAFIGIGGRW